MQHSLTESVKVYIVRNKSRKWLRRVIRVLSCLVVFFTTYALILPAITLEQEVFCGLEEHSHTDECYQQTAARKLVCTPESLALHVHGAGCYDAENNLICGQADYVIHSHDGSCLDSNGMLACTLPERSAHVHTESCYAPPVETAHVHTESCRTKQRGELICTKEEYEGHTHTGSCYVCGEALECTLAENHVHTDACYIYPLICTQSTDPHIHDSSCHTTGDLLCNTPEGHVHGDNCIQKVHNCQSTEEGHVCGDECYTQESICNIPENHQHEIACYADVLSCGKEEDQVHTHDSACYSSGRQLACTLAEHHSHTDACYEKILSCGLEEDPGYRHTDACYNWETAYTCGYEEGEAEISEPELVCTEPTAETHVHGESCFEEVLIQAEPVCGNTAEEHVHTGECYDSVCGLEVHIHVKACYSNPDADVETREVWEATLAHVELSSDRYRDVVAIAETQLGYTESSRNYAVWEDGTVHGYTRYGDWYGVPYGDWCGMFVSFCLRYAGVDNIPINYGVRPWIEDLTELGLYHKAEGYAPKSGDIIFYDWEGDGLSDHVGLLAQVLETEPAQVKAIEGNSENCVQYVTYDMDDPRILGYSELPEKEEVEVFCYCGKEEHVHGDGCYDAEGNLTCQIPEHTHIEECTVAPVYYCGKEKHTHAEECYDADGDVICGKEEHVHTEECTIQPVIYICGLQEHTHSAECYNAEGNLVCGMEEHTHSISCKYDLSILDELNEEDRERVLRVIQIIEKMPSADEIDAKPAEFQAAGDEEGEEVWLTEVYQQIGDIYLEYYFLGNKLQSYVVNAEKLMELEYIWSAKTLIKDIDSASPTVGAYTSTREFVELNLYDYNYNINRWWWSNNKYPGFQWNGGAYSKTDYRYYYDYADRGVPNCTTDRNRVDSIDFGNSMITNFSYGATSDYAKSVGATSVGNQGGNINALEVNNTYGVTNRPIGFSTGTEVLKRTLVNGYPALADGTSLSYLFGDESADTYNAVTKMNTASIDGLFLRNDVTGEYSYNSRENHAQYGSNFFTRYNQIITPNFIVYPFGNFLPLNSISDNSQATQVGAFNKAGGMKTYVNAIKADLTETNNTLGSGDWKYTTRRQLNTMLDEYAENWDWYPEYSATWDNLSPANAIRDYFQMPGDNPSDDVGFVTQSHLNKMYNIDWDVDTNFFFGMEMKMHFMQPKGGMTGNDTNKDGESDYPMVFYFTGDDDVWVYIDDVLFLDLSGIHRHVGGQIDFVNGKVHYYALSPSTGDVSATPYATYTFAQLLQAAGKSTDGLNSSGTFKDYSTHDFNFYYMERGSGSSVCRLNFNFPLLRKNTISVNKENLVINGESQTVQGNPDYYFNIVTDTNDLFVGPGSVTGVTTYKVMDSSGGYIQENGRDKVYTVDQYGIFTLKAGQTAVFEGIDENEGNYFVQELIKAEDNAQYPDVYVNGVETRYNDLIDWTARTYFSDSDSDKHTGPYGFKWYGRSGQDTDSSSNASFYFKQQNHVDAEKLGKLSIQKTVDAPITKPPQDTIYKVNVILDGVQLPVGTHYKWSDGTEKTVTEAGIIEVKADLTATISNIISGTKFEVSETSGSAEGYIVSYGQENGDEANVSNTGVTGIVRVNTEVKVTVTNAENAVTVQIPVSKTLSNGAKDPNTSHAYKFLLTQVADTNGTAMETPYTDTIEISVNGSATAESLFDLSYVSGQFDADTQFPVTCYYQVTEVIEGLTNVIPDESVWLAEVQIEQLDGGKISASLVRLTEGEETGTVAAFTNTLTEDLAITKIVDGSAAAQTGTPFRFTVTLTGADGKPLANQSFAAIFHNKDGATEEATVSTNGDGSFTLSKFYHNETAVIRDLPLGTKWTVTEDNPDNVLNHYLVSWKITMPAESAGEGNSSSGEILPGGSEVTFTNTSTYALPETGGIGTTPYTMAGLLLFLPALCLLYTHTKRERGRR